MCRWRVKQCIWDSITCTYQTSNENRYSFSFSQISKICFPLKEHQLLTTTVFIKTKSCYITSITSQGSVNVPSALEAFYNMTNAGFVLDGSDLGRTIKTLKCYSNCAFTRLYTINWCVISCRLIHNLRTLHLFHFLQIWPFFQNSSCQLKILNYKLS